MVIPIILILSISAIFLVMNLYVETVSMTVEDSRVFEKGFNESKCIRDESFMKAN